MEANERSVDVLLRYSLVLRTREPGLKAIVYAIELFLDEAEQLTIVSY